MNSYPNVFKGSSDVDIMSRRCSLNYYGGCIATTTLDIGVKETQLEQSLLSYSLSLVLLLIYSIC